MWDGVSIDGYSNQTSSVLKGIWLQGDRKGCTVEGGEVPRVVAHSAGFAKTPPPAESLYLQVKEDLDLRRGPIPWAYLSTCLNSGSPGPLGSGVRDSQAQTEALRCPLLVSGCSARGQSWPERPAALCWTGSQAGRGPRLQKRTQDHAWGRAAGLARLLRRPRSFPLYLLQGRQDVGPPGIRRQFRGEGTRRLTAAPGLTLPTPSSKQPWSVGSPAGSRACVGPHGSVQ